MEGLVTWAGKNAIKLIAGGLLIAGVLIWYAWHQHEVAKNASAVPQAQAKVNAAQATAGGNAVNTVNGNQQKNEKTDDRTRAITQNFNTYPAAKAAVDPALFNAFRRGICLYESASDLPECQQLQQPDPQGMEGR